MSDDADIAGCFIRVDIGLAGEHTPESYDALSERLQDLLQEAILKRSDGGPEIDLRGMTCLILGPLGTEDTMDNADEYEENFAPVAEWLSYEDDEE
jgi:hypothetical protein